MRHGNAKLTHIKPDGIERAVWPATEKILVLSATNQHLPCLTDRAGAEQGILRTGTVKAVITPYRRPPAMCAMLQAIVPAVINKGA